MVDILLRSLRINPSIQAYRTLGDVMMRRGDADKALTYYLLTDSFPQSPSEKIQNGLAISYAYVRVGEYFKAKSRLMEILESRPDFQPAIQLLNYVNDRLSGKPAN